MFFFFFFFFFKSSKADSTFQQQVKGETPVEKQVKGQKVYKSHNDTGDKEMTESNLVLNVSHDFTARHTNLPKGKG